MDFTHRLARELDDVLPDPPVEFRKQATGIFQLRVASTSQAELPRSASQPVSLAGGSPLGLHADPRVMNAAFESMTRYGTAAAGTPASSGESKSKLRLEQQLARFFLAPSACVFSNEYLATISTLKSLLTESDSVIYAASSDPGVVEGCRYSGSRVSTFAHHDADELERLLQRAYAAGGRTLVVSSAIMESDGDVIELPDFHLLCRKYGAFLMISESGSAGVIGNTGRGIEEHFDLPAGTVDVRTGSLGCAFSSSGGYLLGSRRLIQHVRAASSGYLHSDAPSPVAIATARAALEALDSEPERVSVLRGKSAYLKRRLQALVPSGRGPDPAAAILNLYSGPVERVEQYRRECSRRGVALRTLEPPLAPAEDAKLQARVSADLELAELDYSADVILSILAGAVNLEIAAGEPTPRTTDELPEPANAQNSVSR